MGSPELDERRRALQAEGLRYALGCMLGRAGSGAEMNVAPNGDVEVTLGGVATISGDELRCVADALTLAREDTLPRDGLGRPAEISWPWDAGTPWVDHLADRWLASTATNYVPWANAEFHVIITHDVDHTTAWEPTLLANALLHQVGLRTHETITLNDALKPRHLVATIERVLEFEKCHQVHSIVFMLCGPYSLARFSSRTSCTWGSARTVIRLTQEAGMDIGLHGSFHARDQSAYAAERKRLEDQVGRPVVHHRNHYLRFDGPRLCDQLEAAGLKFDHSIGFKQRVGFRSGTARPYLGFNRQQGRRSSVRIVPMAFMDTAAAGRSVGEALRMVRGVLLKAREVRGCVSLNFHPELLAASQRAMEIFQETILLARELGANTREWIRGPMHSDELADAESA